MVPIIDAIFVFFSVGSEASSTTASLHNDQNLHLPTANNNLDEGEDLGGISTSGQVDDGGANFRLVLNNNDDDDDDDYDYDEDEEDQEDSGVDLQVREAAGPAHGYNNSVRNGPVMAAEVGGVATMSHDGGRVADHPSGSGVGGGGSGSGRGGGGPVVNSHQQLVLNGGMSAGFKKPFNKKGRLLETLHSQPQEEDSSRPLLAPAPADEPQPGPSSFRPVLGGSVASATAAATTTPRLGTFVATPMPTSLSLELRRTTAVAAEIFSSAGSASLAPATLSVLSSIGAQSRTYYSSAAKTTSASATPSDSLFPVNNGHKLSSLSPSGPPPQPHCFREVSSAPTGASASGPAAIRLAPEKSYSDSLGIGLAFSRLPGSSSLTASQLEANNKLTSAAGGAAATAPLSGPLSKRLRTRHYQDTVARTEGDGGPTLADQEREAQLRFKPDVSLSLMPLSAAAGPLLTKEESEAVSNGNIAEATGLFLPLLVEKQEKEEEESGGPPGELDDDDEEDENDDEEEDDEEDGNDRGGRSSRYSFLGE